MTIDELKHKSDVFVVVADHSGIITHTNDAAQKVLGWVASDLVGKPLSIIIPKQLRDAHHLGFSRFLTSGKPTLLNQPLQLKILSKEGKELDAEHFIIAEQKQGKWSFGAMIRLV